MMSAYNKQSGFTLIEVLIAALILSIGLVGVATLQIVTVKNTQGAFMRSQASALAYDLADRMRANVPSVIAGHYNDAAAGVLTATCKTTAGCTPQQMALNDLSEWDSAIALYLPMGEGWVCIDSTPHDGINASTPSCDGAGNQYAVKIWWDNDGDGAISNDNTIANVERMAFNFEL